MTTNHGIGVLALALAIACFCGCREQMPLPRPIPCGPLLTLRFGDARSDVERSIGAPINHWSVDRPLPDGTEVDEYADYKYGRSPDPYELWDQFGIYYTKGQLTRIDAFRDLAGRAAEQAGTGRLLAFRMTRNPAGALPDETLREIGPAFEDVFQCEPGFRRPVR